MRQFIIQYFIEHGYTIDSFIAGGIRNKVNHEMDMFNDWLWFIYDNEFNVAKGTTDPGVYYTDNPMNKEGAFHLATGYHKDIWTIDKHAGKYYALCNRYNCKPQKGWRDINKNSINDDNKIVEGHFGANWHYTNNEELILRASAGCQVTNNFKFFEHSMICATASEQKFFSYMLFDIEEIPTNIIIDIDNQIRGEI